MATKTEKSISVRRVKWANQRCQKVRPELVYHYMFICSCSFRQHCFPIGNVIISQFNSLFKKSNLLRRAQGEGVSNCKVPA